jgi:hypothetical protein
VRHSTGFKPVLGIKFNQFEKILKNRRGILSECVVNDQKNFINNAETNTFN